MRGAVQQRCWKAPRHSQGAGRILTIDRLIEDRLIDLKLMKLT